MKTKRQGLITSVKELLDLAAELSAQRHPDDNGVTTKFQLNIINRAPECSDTWEFEEIK